MKILSLVFLCVSTTICLAQSPVIESTWIKGSDILFIGVENKLILKSIPENFLPSPSGSSLVMRSGDTLIVKPVQPGKLEIVLKSGDQTVKQELHC